jgi:phosphoribosylformylglycinamidine (FGAM) synthase-like amidotransferase family enzyme
MPIAHSVGNYEDSSAKLDALEDAGQVVFRYAAPDGTTALPDSPWNPNGSARGIAGIVNAHGNVLGLMPHPERCVEAILGNTDGRALLVSAVESAAPQGGTAWAGAAAGVGG